VGIYYTLNGHWNGIDPDSDLGLQYRDALFSWIQRERPDVEDAPEKIYWFLSPVSPDLQKFFDTWNEWFRDQGFALIKVDNQSVTERMSVNTYPIMDLSRACHEQINSAAATLFNGGLINCMNMTAEAYYNFGTSAVARTVEDYFEYSPGENYNLERGNAAAHVLQAVYNSLYFSQMVYTDFDMFQSHHPHAVMHGIARAFSGGPVYVSDRPGHHKPEVLWPLITAEGRILRADRPLLPTRDCLFQLQDPGLFKTFSLSRGVGVLTVMNCADVDSVGGTLKPSDVEGLPGATFGLFDYFHRSVQILRRHDVLGVTLPRMGVALYYVAPLDEGEAVLGLLEKYNAPASVRSASHDRHGWSVVLEEGGAFGAILRTEPRRVLVDGVDVPVTFHKHLLVVPVPGLRQPGTRSVRIEY
jgi:hypothetical protein